MKVNSIDYTPISSDNPVPETRIRREDSPKTQETQNSDKKNDKAVVSERAIIEAIEKANKVTISHNTRAEFSVHEVTKDIMIKIIDTDKNEVIREFPPKKFLDLIAKLWDLAGIVVDERR